MTRTCSECGTTKKEKDYRFWWSLSDYFGITGYFCPGCYTKVSHDSYGKPTRPAEYMMILLRRGLQ